MWFVQVIEDVRELCREILETRSPSEQERVQPEMEDMFRPVPPPPLTPTLSVISEASAGSTPSLGMTQLLHLIPIPLSLILIHLSLYPYPTLIPYPYTYPYTLILPYTLSLPLSLYTESLSLSSHKKFKRTPQHSQIFDAKDSAKVRAHAQAAGQGYMWQWQP